jgi:hypothetical protein
MERDLEKRKKEALVLLSAKVHGTRYRGAPMRVRHELKYD